MTTDFWTFWFWYFLLSDMNILFSIILNKVNCYSKKEMFLILISLKEIWLFRANKESTVGFIIYIEVKYMKTKVQRSKGVEIELHCCKIPVLFKLYNTIWNKICMIYSYYNSLNFINL